VEHWWRWLAMYTINLALQYVFEPIAGFQPLNLTPYDPQNFRLDFFSPS
jgi:hypothetical protein